MTSLEIRLCEQLDLYEKEMLDMFSVFCEAVDNLGWAMDMLRRVKKECPSLFYQAIGKEELEKISGGGG